MKNTLLLFFLLLISALITAQSKVEGFVFDKQTKQAVSHAAVAVGTMQTQTNEAGYFSISLLANNYVLFVSAEGYEAYSNSLIVGNENLKIDTVFLSPRAALPSDASGIAEVELGSSDYESSKESQNVSGLLHSTNDVFKNVASFNFSSLQYKIRGYDSEYEDIYINGMIMNDAENGRPTYSEWGGLNEATRNKQDVDGVEAAPFAFGNIGGVTNINTRASAIRRQQKISYALSNRSYNNRITLTYATGMMKNNWAFAVDASKRWSQEGMVPGTFYDAWSFFGSAEKKINSRNSINISLIGAPYKRGLSGPAVQEVYDLTGDKLYNPNWGFQNGEVRNARVRKAFEPKLILNHYWNKTEKLSFVNTLGISYSRYGTTALNWYDAPDPRPDYYRYLPSYQTETDVIADVTEAWKNDAEGEQTLTQVNWNHLYQVNYLANLAGSQAKYIIEERRDDHLRFVGATNFRYEKDDHISFNGGFELQHFQGYHYKTLVDLLGGEYWMDIDQFAERDFSGDSTKLINDLNDPNRVIKEGDNFGYNYTSYINNAKLWGMAVMTQNKIDAWIAANISYNNFYRVGNMLNGRYPDNSEGKSEVKNYINYGVKAGATWKISGRYYLQANAGYLTKTPLINNVFTSIRISNKMIDDIKIENDLSMDLNFIHKGTRWNYKVSAYQTYINNQTEVVGFYHDVYRTYVNMIVTGVNKVHQGIELGTNYKISKTVSAVAALGIGNFRYVSRPNAVITFENGSMPDTTQTIYAKNFYQAGTPQTVGSLGLKYSSPKFWFVDVNFNYFNNTYIDFNPQRRTQAAIVYLQPGDPLISEITKQEKVKGGYTVDFSVGKTWKIKKYTLGLNLNVSNVFNNQFVTGGFEQMRFDYETKDLGKFPPKYFYNYGRTFFLMLSVRI